jgi:sugar phosphate isomerase/epimerase
LAALPLFGAFERPLGVQLYTVRNELTPATLKAIAAIGYKEVEVTLATAKGIAQGLKDAGLAPTGAHIDGSVTSLTAEKMDGFIQQARELGIPAIGLAYVPPSERKDPETFFPAFADLLNFAGDRCRRAGLAFYYHHHNFEFDPRGNGIEVLHEKLSRNVKLEIDCFWASVAGMDPVSFIERWDGRLFALHLKDKARGTPVSYETDRVKHDEFLEVGAGVIDWGKVLAAGVKAGARHFYVEQDYTPGDPVESLRKSYQFLRK